MENHGTDYSRRWKRLRESIEAMKTIWSEEEASYEGEFVRFERIWSWPKPLQSPHPPVIVGGNGERTLQRVIRYGDEWMPIGLSANAGLEPRIQELREMAAAAGRGHIPVTIFGLSANAEEIQKTAAAGAERIVFPVRASGLEDVGRRLDTLAHIISDCES